MGALSRAPRRAVKNDAPIVANHLSPPLRGRSQLNVYALAHFLSQTEWWPIARLRNAQYAQADELIRFAYATVPFYRDRLADYVGDDVETALPEKFAALPILTREELQREGEAISSPVLPRGHGPKFDVHTSGSSGRPVHVRSTALANISNLATALRGHQWFRRDLASSHVSIKVLSSDRERIQVKVWATGSSGQAHLYSNRVAVRRLYDWLQQDRPAHLQCHPSTLQALIHRSRAIGEKPIGLRDVRTMGEVLEPGLRALCQAEWGVPVRDNYSSEEFGTLALTCPKHDHLHIQAERAIVEILDDQNRPCAPGETGRVVVTGLLNFATPLIRHELGDRAVVGAPCSCGRGLPVIERIIGRERDAVVLPSGDRVFPVLDAEPLLMKGGVRQYQLIQRNTKRIDLNLVADTPLSADDETEITQHLQRNFGHPFEIEFIYVEEIERGPGGKFQIFKSETE